MKRALLILSLACSSCIHRRVQHLQDAAVRVQQANVAQLVENLERAIDQKEMAMDNLSLDIQKMIAELTAAGWVQESQTRWRSPDGGLFLGPYGAWKVLKGIQ